MEKKDQIFRLFEAFNVTLVREWKGIAPGQLIPTEVVPERSFNFFGNKCPLCSGNIKYNYVVVRNAFGGVFSTKKRDFQKRGQWSRASYNPRFGICSNGHPVVLWREFGESWDRNDTFWSPLLEQ